MRTVLCLLLLCLNNAMARGASEIVIAMRYLQAQGTSHAHLYLYRDDGKFLRQLTNDQASQESDPIFAPDGETIVFTREVSGGAKQFWSVEPRGGNLRQLPAAPDWYAQARTSPFFLWWFPDEKTSSPTDAPFGQRTQRFTAPDGSVELILEEKKDDEDDQMNGPGHGKHYRLHDLKTGEETRLATLPGFEGLVDPLRLGNDGPFFFLQPPLRLVFFAVHLDSTDGDTDYALDLNAPRRLVRLSPNWAAPFPLPGEPAFLTLTSVRYLPIPGSKKTANCSFVERWDAKLNKVRFAQPDSAAIVSGASMYRPGRTPAVVTIRKAGD